VRRTIGIVGTLSILLVTASVAGAQVRVGRDSTTRLLRFGRDMLYGTAEGLGFAAYDQWQNDPEEWGNGAAGYGRRAASNIGEFLIQEGVTEGVAAIMKRPLDYTPCGCGRTTKRIWWAVRGAVTDQLPDGSHPIAVPRILGAFTGSIAQARWRPSHGHDRTRVGLVNGATSLGIGALINLYKEFR